MKKLLAMFLALLMSLTNNTTFSVVDTKPYPGPGIEYGDPGDDTDEPDDTYDEFLDSNAGYYTIDADDPTDYRTINSKNVENVDKNKCKTATFSWDPRTVPNSNGFWVINGVTPTEDNIKVGTASSQVHHFEDKDDAVEYYVIGGLKSDDGSTINKVFTDSSCIVMPYDGVIHTDGSMSIDTMTVICSKTSGSKTLYYKLFINNLRCWYCDLGRSGALDTNKPLTISSHTFKSLKDKAVDAGNILGLATEDTTITVYACNKNGKVLDKAVSVEEFYKN